ncbi:hypothetical protein BU15DRAFT_50543, partial [Melanogaster broomeanus]
DSQSNAGRAIRRLVSLTDDIGTLVDEHDRRLLDSVDAAQCTEEENRRYCCYKELVQWVPSIKQLLHSQAEEHVLRQAFKEFKHGAEAARSDDSSSLKKVIAHWLNECSPPPNPLIKVGSKSRRGLYNNATAELLCPVEYDWSDKTTRKNIRGFHPKFLVTAYQWPKFLYKGGTYDRTNPSKGLFKGELLLKAFKHIFTSPSSTSPDEGILEDQDDEEDVASGHEGSDSEPSCKRHKPMDMRQMGRSHVRFSLSSCKSWRNNDAGFEHDIFYNHIVNWFEHPKDSKAKARVDEALLWWNRNVFGSRNAASFCPQPVVGTSVAAALTEQCGDDVVHFSTGHFDDPASD